MRFKNLAAITLTGLVLGCYNPTIVPEVRETPLVYEGTSLGELNNYLELGKSVLWKPDVNEGYEFTSVGKDSFYVMHISKELKKDNKHHEIVIEDLGLLNPNVWGILRARFK